MKPRFIISYTAKFFSGFKTKGEIRVMDSPELTVQKVQMQAMESVTAKIRKTLFFENDMNCERGIKKIKLTVIVIS